MSVSSRLLAVTLLSLTLAAPLGARAEEAAAPAAMPETAAKEAAMPAATPMPMMGMRQQMRAMSGDGMGQHCRTGKRMAGGKPPCMGPGGKCPTAAGLEQRLDAMDKRLDMMQMMLEMMVRQQGSR